MQEIAKEINIGNTFLHRLYIHLDISKLESDATMAKSRYFRLKKLSSSALLSIMIFKILAPPRQRAIPQTKDKTPRLVVRKIMQNNNPTAPIR